jgi:hypothetical protein
MRFRILISALLASASAPLIGQATAASAPSADEVIARMLVRDVQREAAAGGYTGNRQYVLDNPRFEKQARMVVSVTCGPDGTKNFQVVSEQGWKSANNRVLRKMLESESESSRPAVRPKARITSDNYSFQLIKAAPLDGRLAYVIDVIPKHKDAYSFRGRIWVDAEDYALARAEGEPAKTPSIWIRSVHFAQEYRKSGDYWFPWSTSSVSEARAFGETEVDIHYFNYFARSRNTDRDTDPELAEARNVKY